MTDDTLPPHHPHEQPTLEQLPPVNDTEPPPPEVETFGVLHTEFGVITLPEVIAAGQAESTLAAALDRLATAFVEVEATAMALARLVDLQASQGVQS